MPSLHSHMVNPQIYVVDDDPSTLAMIEHVLVRQDLQVQTFLSAEPVLGLPVHDGEGAFLLDVRLPDINGVDLMLRLREIGWRQPAILITAHADVPMAVQAMKDGAFDFVEKDVCSDALLDTVARAIQQDRRQLEQMNGQAELASRRESLTRREMEVAQRLVKGDHTKRVALELSISPKTVEFHRANILRKMQAESVVDLTRLFLQFDAQSCAT